MEMIVTCRLSLYDFHAEKKGEESTCFYILKGSLWDHRKPSE